MSRRSVTKLGLSPSAQPTGRPTRRKAARLGQHFLMHPRIAERIVQAAPTPKGITVVEIGPGKGILTRELMKRAEKVIAIELDPQLFAKLQDDFAADVRNGRLELIHGDVRELDLAGLPKRYAVVANIPYYITGEIIRTFLESAHQPVSMTLLVQKEVAERIARAKKESILSLSVKAYGEPAYEFTVPKGAFLPPPSVDSAVLTIGGISRKHFDTKAQEKRFFDLVHAGFAHKRKLVRSNLCDLVPETAIERTGVLANARAEDLPLSAWLTLARRVS